jgi:hypothetical protein
LGNFQYDPRKSPLLPGELLQANVGATIEIRVSGKHLGLGPMRSALDGMSKEDGCGWGLGWRVTGAKDGVEKDRSSLIEEREVDGDNVEGDTDDDALAFWNQDALLNRKVWGTDVYTDDSDIVAMCLHAGWIKGPTLQDVPSWVPPGKATLAWRQMTKVYDDQGMQQIQDSSNGAATGHKKSKRSKAERVEQFNSTLDLSVIIRIAPKLIAYKGSQRCGVKTRSWGNGHDGVSLVIESIKLQEPGYASGEKGLRNIKERIDHLARLKTLAMIAIDDTVADQSLVEKVEQGGLINIWNLSREGKEKDDLKPFWQIDVHEGRLLQ